MSTLGPKERPLSGVSSATPDGEMRRKKRLTSREVDPIIQKLRTVVANPNTGRTSLQSEVQALYREGYVIDDIINALPDGLEEEFLEAMGLS
ncbi:MAG: hypothetical protein A3J93_00195 [Candidatus Magasanikbacteria bacterium RIFOXYC2_FULL_42_28]|uniref:Uncharacterized protein n=1 Tax=Candidatus Magasanikbacteria bacterium RIFOXYC2_FULL_42_28 TaxID=1798704 RepID=A0A1F6NW50_9BACT|nr:MAG: hypothetical protein A3J93_00195 [Candidatus Magasanikbacteria bacterium RIFOXYC2_FULL_42_28]